MCLDLRFFTKEICPYYCRFLHTQKDSGGASIHRILESFPLKPSLSELIYQTFIFQAKITIALLQSNLNKEENNEKASVLSTIYLFDCGNMYH